jgi:hypothetical protein
MLILISNRKIPARFPDVDLATVRGFVLRITRGIRALVVRTSGGGSSSDSEESERSAWILSSNV